mgnify:CR=1 FL=1
MSKQRINVGSGTNTGDGDTLRAAMIKANNNFDELYDIIGQDSTGKSIDISGNIISSTFTNTDIIIEPNGSGDIVMSGDLVANIIKSDDSTGIIINDNLILTGIIKADDSSIVRIGENLDVAGTITAQGFSGDGSGLTGLTGVGSGVAVQDNGVLEGTAATINFSDGLSLAFAGGTATVTFTGPGDSTETFTNVLRSNDSTQIEVADNLVPQTDNTFSLGTPDKRWSELYVAGSSIHIGNLILQDSGTGSLQILNADSTQATIQSQNDTLNVVGDDSTDMEILIGTDRLYFQGGTNISTSTDSGAQLTISVADAPTFSGVVTSAGLTVGSAELNESDLEQIDGLTAGTVAASKALIVDSNRDIATVRNITSDGTVQFGSLSDGTITVTAFVDEDDMSSNSATLIPTQQSVKAYVDSELSTVSTTLNVIGDDSTDMEIQVGTDRLFFQGGTNITTSTDSGAQLTISVDDSPTFTNVQIDGNLTVSGTTTSINTTNLEIQDPIIELNKNNSGGADVDAGIFIQRGSAGNNAVFYWNEGDDKFKAVLSNSVATATSITDSSTATIVANLEGNVTGNADTATALATARSIGGVSFDGTGDINLPGVNTSGNQNTSGTAAVATTVTVTDNESTNEENVVTFVAGADSDGGNVGLESDGNFTYNPSTGTVTATKFKGDGSELTGIAGSSGSSTLNIVGDDSTDMEVTVGTDRLFFQGGTNVTTSTDSGAQLTISVSDAPTFSGTVTFGSISDGTITVTAFVDEDDMSSNSATLIPTQQSVKAYVDNEISGVGGGSSTLNVVGDDSTDMEIALGTDRLFFQGGTNITTSTDSGAQLTISVDDAPTFSGAVTASSFVIGSADINETDLEKLDGITDGTVAANKAVVVDTNKDAGSFRNITATGTITTATLDVNSIESTDSTAVRINEGLDVVGTLQVNNIESLDSTQVIVNDIRVQNITANDSSAIQIDDATNFNGAVQVNSTITATGNIETSGSLVIGDASMNEADLEQLDGLTPGTITASKAVVVDSNKDIASFRNVTATGSFIIGSADMNETDLEKLDGITNGTVAANKAVITDGNKDISGFRNIVMDGNIEVGGNLTVSGTTTSVNTTNLEISDSLLELNKNNSGGSDVDAGLLIQRGSAGNNAALYWNEGDDKFKAVLTSSDASATSVTDSSTATIVANIEGSTATISTINTNQISAADSSSVQIDVINTNTISSSDSTSVTINDGIIIVGNLSFDGGVATNTILDEDNFSSNSNTALATQQSIKAYVDAEDANIASDTLTFTNKTFDANGTGNSLSNVEVADFAGSAIVTESEGLASSDNDTSIPTTAAVKDYVDTNAGGTLALGDSASNAGSVNISGGQDLEVKAGNSITPTVAGNGVTIALNDDISINQIAAKDSSAVSITSPLQVASNVQVSGVISQSTAPSSSTHLVTKQFFDDNAGQNGFPNSTTASFPVTDDSTATDFHEGSDGIGSVATTDAFGVSVTTVYDCMEPIGSLSTTDFGASESHVGA